MAKVRVRARCLSKSSEREDTTCPWWWGGGCPGHPVPNTCSLPRQRWGVGNVQGPGLGSGQHREGLQTPPGTPDTPRDGRGAEGDSWSATSSVKVPISLKAGPRLEHGSGWGSRPAWPPPPRVMLVLESPRPALLPLAWWGGGCGSPAPSSPAGLGGVNHPSVCDSALALKEARPHADAWDIPGMGQGPKLWPGGGRKSLLDQASGLAP